MVRKAGQKLAFEIARLCWRKKRFRREKRLARQYVVANTGFIGYHGRKDFFPGGGQ